MRTPYALPLTPLFTRAYPSGKKGILYPLLYPLSGVRVILPLVSEGVPKGVPQRGKERVILPSVSEGEGYVGMILPSVPKEYVPP